MRFAAYIRRSLRAAARRDQQDRIKQLVLAIARIGNTLGISTEEVKGVSSLARRRAAIKLLQYAFPDWQTPVLVLGRDSRALSTAIRQAGYERCTGSDTLAGAEFAVETRAPAGSASAVMLIVDLLEWMDRGELGALLERFRALAPARIAASIRTYPECIWDTHESGRRLILERRQWWEHLLGQYGFEAAPSPRENLPGLSPFLFRPRREPVEMPAWRGINTVTVRSARTIFALPDTQNAFLWVAESLAAAMNECGHEAAVVSPSFAPDPAYSRARNRISWAHYWREYREAAQRTKPNYEIFAANFEMQVQGRRTRWVEEMCARDSVKIAISNFCKDVLLNLGVPENKILVVPHGYSPEFTAPAAPVPLATRKTFRFLAVTNSHDPYRYGTDILLRAYRNAFGPNDDVCLVVKDYAANTAATESWFDDAGGPEILYYANFVEKADLAAFYVACSAFVAPFRGEGFGMKILDAAVAGLPLIVPLYGGPLDYSIPELVEPVAFERRPVGKCLETEQIEWNERLAWCEPNPDDLARRMRAVFENRGEAVAKAEQLRAAVLPSFSWEAAARKLIAILE